MYSQRQRVEKERLILVEGQDEVNLFRALLEHLDNRTVQVLEAGGRDKFPALLGMVLSDARVNSVELKVIGIVRDADESAESAFESVCSVLRTKSLPVPPKPREVAMGAISTAVLIVPDDHDTGSIEDLCWRSVENLAAARCVEEYLDCLNGNNSLESTSHSKTRIHAFLASKQDPSTTVGVGARKGYWPLDAPAFDVLREFVRMMSQG